MAGFEPAASRARAVRSAQTELHSKDGYRGGIRTRADRFNRPALCQLSYPVKSLMDRVGFEPTTSCLRGRHSGRLSYRSISNFNGTDGTRTRDLSLDRAAATPTGPRSRNFDAPGRTRTFDRAVINRVLCHLSLRGKSWDARIRTSIGSFKDYRPAS